MATINENEYIDKITLSKNIDKVIINESKILKNNLKNREVINSNSTTNYV